MKVKTQTLIFMIAFVKCCYSLHIKTNTQISLNHNQNGLNNHKNSHLYYSLQNTRQVSQSKSIKHLNFCKDECLKMKEVFPFAFKYHRVVYRQQMGDLKYVTGECLYSFLEQKQPIDDDDYHHLIQKNHLQNNQQSSETWYSWQNLIGFVQIAPIKNQNYVKQKQTWQKFNNQCQNKQLKLEKDSILNFKLTLTHSNFEYYDNGGFKNLEPFTDIDDLLKNIS